MNQEQNKKIFRPIRDLILVQLPKVTEVSKGGIILDNKTQTREQYAHIVAIGNKVENEELKVGMKVLIELGQFKLLKMDGYDDCAMVEEKFIIGIYDE